MTATVRRLVVASVAAAILVFAAATLLFQLHGDIGGGVGVAFWTGLALVGSALTVQLPRGVVASVTLAPLLASLYLGGPIAAGIVALIGATDVREVRREIPWYGTTYNHSAAVIAAVIGGMAFEGFRRLSESQTSELQGPVLFLGLLVAAVILVSLNGALAVIAVSARTGASLTTIWAQDVRGIAVNLIGLVPLGWLMSQVFLLPNGVGWWATPLFVVPLFTTRLAYHRYVETRELFEQTIGALAKAIDARDKYTRGHSNRVSWIAENMCRVMKLPESEIEKILWAGLLHDVGKIGVRDNILLKEGPLDKEERVLMNQHPTIGAEIVQPARQLTEEAPLIEAHHEWFNGSGYPKGREAFDIPLGARILSVADAYEAMTSARPYRKQPLSHEIAIAELQKYAGIQFDPDIVPVLVGLDRSILDRRLDNPDELPTMMHTPDPREAQDEPANEPEAAASREIPPEAPQSRPMLTSDDVS